MIRSATIYRHQKERAAKDGQTLDYTLAHVRLWQGPYPNTNWNLCTYCETELTVDTFGLDLREPVSRGGTHSYLNIAICCMRCNQVKGNMNEDEYRRLLAGLKLIHPDAAKSIMARLRAGAKATHL